MSFTFAPRADSSDEDAAVDLSAWQSGAKRKRDTPPRRSSGFQAVNQPSEHVEMEMEPEPEPEPEPALLPAPAPVAQVQASAEAADPMLISSDKESRDDDDEEEEAAPMPIAGQDESAGGGEQVGQDEEEDDEIEVQPWPEEEEPEEEELVVPTSKITVSVSRDELEDEDPAEFEDFTAGGDVVTRVLKEQQDEEGLMAYVVEFEDQHVEELPFESLLGYTNGSEALDAFENEPPPPRTKAKKSWPSKGRMSSTRPRARSSRQNGYVNTIDAISGDELASDDEPSYARRSGRRKKQDQTQYTDAALSDESEDELGSDNTSRHRSGRAATTTRRSTQAGRRTSIDDEDRDVITGDSSDDEAYLLQSDLPGARKRTRKSLADEDDEDGTRSRRKKSKGEATRHSGRSTRHMGDMEEVDVDNIYRSDSDSALRVAAKPKPIAAKEIFQQLPRNNEFRMRHAQYCETCGNGANYAPLIFCQGCTLTYHKTCLGHRTNREHLVTKVGEEDFVLQCRRCVAFARKKDRIAPDQGKCQDCHHHGHACRPFRPRKTPTQEQREREENDGVDPSYAVDTSRINNADNVLFRCITCWRGFHFEHLPSRTDMMELDTEADVEQRFREYSRDWKCKDCLNMPAKVSGLIAWKPTDEDNYDDAMLYDLISEDEKAYLVRWEGQSYFRACWMPGAWVWGITAPAMRKAFGKREEAQRPKMRTEEAIPEDYLRTDIVLDIKFTSIVDIQTEDIDKARIREVDKALIKYKGLGYEDAVWEKPPTPEDGDRWTDFVTAYNDWVMGRYVKPPRSGLKARLEKARKQDFSSLEKQTQPENIEGGELMKYQMEGLNWLYYKWFTQSNAILADEMGLGKTIQIIGFLATLVQDWTCFPFLVVVPNSTCPNWRREIKRWAPSLRVVAYYGSKESRDLAYRYEMFPNGCKDLRCHVVVTSYDAAADDNCRKFFRNVSWQGLIVDEGQRLKSEKTQLYSALGALKAPFKILMTGTPLQNNQRELFNLLQFLDDSYKAEELEQEFADLDQAKIVELHEKIRPFFLRRTKAQVLTFLPPMAQIILPVSMSVLQKKVYRTIIAKNPDLMRSIFSNEQNMGKSERGSLSNVLMQLRKCLCHPFVYSKGIEERSDNAALSHRNLVDASSKLRLLELLLPKLQERGHRVLIFSQFLDMLDMVEDFLDGMAMQYQRLDGSIGSLQKQKRIDKFNAPDSSLFAFLLSTRAGGVGINLATADTVIILDPDFNPHQDIQALSRAHRIGQTKKVLCFQLVTRASAEEKIMQIGRKKLALDHVLIQNMDTDEADENDLASILRYGANELFDDAGDQDVVYDNPSIDRLLDRSQIEDTSPGGDRSAETQWSQARIWANHNGALEEAAVEVEEQAPDPGVWANILRERERVAAEEAATKAEAFGRGRRARGNVDYGTNKDGVEGGDDLNIEPLKKRRKTKTEGESDTDFQADDSDAESGAEGELPTKDGEGLDRDDAEVIAKQAAGRKKNEPPTFRRANIPSARIPTPSGLPTPPDGASTPNSALPAATDDFINCIACRTYHAQGSCPLKLAGVEHCNLCGMAHFGHARVCPHIQSETQVRSMLEALKLSNEPEHLVREATRYLKGLKGNLVQLKKQKAAKEHAAREEAAHAANMAGYTTGPSFRMPPVYGGGQQGGYVGQQGGYGNQQGGYGIQQGFGAGYETLNHW